MEHEFWHKRWQTKDIGFHKQDVDADLIAHFSEWKPKLPSRILVPLCGKSKDMVWLAEQGYDITGVELSTIACDEFFLELGVKPEVTKHQSFTLYRHNNIELLCGDLFSLQPEDLKPVQAIYDCGALVALPADLRKKYIKQLGICCGVKVRILLLAFESNSIVPGPPFSLSVAEINLLYKDFDVKQIKCEVTENIPKRFIKKGYLDMKETVYLMSEKKTSN